MLYASTVAGLLALACARTPTSDTPTPEKGHASAPGASGESGESKRSNERSPPSDPVSMLEGYFYTFSLSDKHEALLARVCFDAPVPERLEAPTAAAAGFMVGAQLGRRRLQQNEDGLVLLGVGRGDCIDYRVDLARLFDASSLRSGAGRVDDDIVLSPDWYVWLPEDAHRDVPVYARFGELHGLRPVLPWPLANVADYGLRITPSAVSLAAQGAFARNPKRVIAIGSERIEVTVLGDGLGPRTPAVLDWVEASALAVRSLLGSFPAPTATVLIVADSERQGTFGFLTRGGGPMATLLTPAPPTDSELREDWSAVHEFMHLSLPPMNREATWLSEGFTTYFTAIARAKAGAFTVEDAWWELLDGFERGSKVGTGKTLRDECIGMRENRTYWRVYWSGVAMALEMDVALRRSGRPGLLSLLTETAAAGLDRTRVEPWAAEQVIARLDRACACSIPGEVMERHLDEVAFPDTASLRRALGVELAPMKRVLFDDDAPDATIRQAIIAGPDSKPAFGAP
jgi:hypothetical protein